jgi:Ca2+-binding EF-hand superfamily protein
MGGSMMFGGGMMGGFDPSSMLSRFDRNGNKMLDPDELQGPARFFIDRMAQSNPKIDPSKPIPLDVISGEFERLRAERMGGFSGGFGGSWGGGAPVNEAEGSGPKPLVPEFGLPVAQGSVRSFGSAGEESQVEVTPRDIAEAEDRLRRYDRNQDGFLSTDELSGGRWRDDPMQFDRNGDKRLSKEELGMRYAKQRIAEEQAAAVQQGGSGGEDPRSRWGRGSSMMFMGGSGGGFGGGGQDGGGQQEGEKKPEPTKWEKYRSLKQLSSKEKSDKVSGKPDWFTRDDADGDSQISMNEFSSKWDEKTLANFQLFDLNADGFITTVEVLKAVSNGATKGSSGSSVASSSGRGWGGSTSGSNSGSAPASVATSGSAPAPASGSSPTPSASGPAVATATPAPASTSSSPASAGASAGGVDQKLLDWSQKQIKKYDKNSDGVLTANEWSEMSIPPPNGTDGDGDGRITAEEYARYRSKK